MMNKENIHKLERSVCDYCKMATSSKRIPVIIFTNKEDKQKLREVVDTLGGSIRHELEILGAYAVDIAIKHISELIDYDTVNYIAPDEFSQY